MRLGPAVRRPRPCWRTALIWARLAAARRGGRIEGQAAPIPCAAPEVGVAPSGVGAAMVAEFRRVARRFRGVRPDRAGAPRLRPALSAALSRAVAAQSADRRRRRGRSELSRELIRSLDADEALRSSAAAGTLAEAQQAMARREVFGIVAIPAGRTRRLSRRPARVAAYVNSGLFPAVSRAPGRVRTRSPPSTRRSRPAPRAARRQPRPCGDDAASPVEFLTEPLTIRPAAMRATSVPAAFILILQQTLLMGAATLGASLSSKGARRRGGCAAASAPCSARRFAHVCLALPGLALYLLVLPRALWIFHAGAAARSARVRLSLPAFGRVSSASSSACWFKRRESARCCLHRHEPCRCSFMVGVAWPVEAIPEVAARLQPRLSQHVGHRRPGAHQSDGRDAG